MTLGKLEPCNSLNRYEPQMFNATRDFAMPSLIRCQSPEEKFCLFKIASGCREWRSWNGNLMQKSVSGVEMLGKDPLVGTSREIAIRFWSFQWRKYKERKEEAWLHRWSTTPGHLYNGTGDRATEPVSWQAQEEGRETSPEHFCQASTRAKHLCKVKWDKEVPSTPEQKGTGGQQDVFSCIFGILTVGSPTAATKHQPPLVCLRFLVQLHLSEF